MDHAIAILKQLTDAGWPFSVFFMVLVALLILRRGLVDFLRRATSIGRSGITAAEAQKEAAAQKVAEPQSVLDPVAAEAPAALPAHDSEAEKLMARLDTPFTLQIEKELLDDLQKRSINDVNTRVLLLSRVAAAAWVEAQFQSVEGAIWGSQLRIFHYLNTIQSLGLGALRSYYDQAKAVNPAVARNAATYRQSHGVLTVSIITFSLSSLISRVVLVEAIFSYPGIGDLIIDAVRLHDYPVIEGSLFYLTIMVIIGGLIGDFVLLRLDPRLRV